MGLPDITEGEFYLIADLNVSIKHFTVHLPHQPGT